MWFGGLLTGPRIIYFLSEKFCYFTSTNNVLNGTSVNSINQFQPSKCLVPLSNKINEKKSL